ncbi:RTA1 domain [Moesziomyces antarcticus]|uniref:RTA1 domain n=1 Tax=Pseudozyma antarctica TaxID=84753 RepID=A0A081CLT4_PSEA2|nr:RTA1 domain [Moesziomyces antarcticus]GAK67630.1 RTA1 domain [Moesziomyces antarcticus]
MPKIATIDPVIMATAVSRRAWTSQDLARGPYGYLPVLSAPIIFASVGHALRVYGHFEPFDVNAYISMQCILVITPALIAAVDFAILGKVAVLFPPKYSLVNARWILPFFVALDVASLGVQGGGSAIAAIAQMDNRDPTSGGNIVVAGLAIQLVGYILFNTLLVVFVRRCSKDPPPEVLWNKKTRTFLAATAVSSALIFARSTFRLIEMSVGWIGVIAKTEWTFYVFDAALVTLAVFIFNVFNPAVYLGQLSETNRGNKDSVALDERTASQDSEASFKA